MTVDSRPRAEAYVDSDVPGLMRRPREDRIRDHMAGQREVQQARQAYVYVVTFSALGEEVGEFFQEQAFISEVAALPACFECMDHHGGRDLFTEARHRQAWVCRRWDSPRFSVWLEKLAIQWTGEAQQQTGTEEGTWLSRTEIEQRAKFYSDAIARQQASAKEIERLTTQLNTPEILDFSRAVVLEAAHQRERWGEEHDTTKTDADWFWLIGYLAGKALHNPPKPESDPVEKRLHRIITVAAAAGNWHRIVLMRKDPDKRPAPSPEDQP